MPPVNPTDRRQPYLQVADDLREKIANGTYEVGQPLKSYRALAEEYGVAPMTISKAIDLLRSEKVVGTWQGRPSIVLGISEAEQPPPDEVVQVIIHRLEALQNELSTLSERVAELESVDRRGQQHES